MGRAGTAGAGAPAPVLPPQPIPRSFPGWFPFLILLLFAGIIAGGIYGWHRLSLWRRAQNAPSASSQTKESAPLIVASAPIRAASRANDPEASAPDLKTPPPSTRSSRRSSILPPSLPIALPPPPRATPDGHVPPHPPPTPPHLPPPPPPPPSPPPPP